ncbi:MAG: purine-nucleoside phosphorylase [Coriobacteriaceae bacterium]|jgi:purine-nucleoside phosphorylase|nr:purine-nucleoside phosphorylase [Coriobacteriaceae bacterium]
MGDVNTLDERLAASREALCAHLGQRRPRIGLVLGSGLSPLADDIADAACIPYADIPHMNESTVASHVGQFVCGTLAGREVICMQGRLHGYEGNTAHEVAYPIWLLAGLGVTTLIVTNAAGAINAGYGVGDLCIIADHINFTGRNPAAGLGPDTPFERFFSMTDAYDPARREAAHAVAQREGITAHEGVYLGLSGPSFETPAEIRAFRAWGADTVGMSTVEEVIAARQRGLRVLGVSLVTNMAAGIQGASPSSDEVLGVAEMSRAGLSRLIQGVLAGL